MEQRALSHFGVPGMKWGVRRAANGVRNQIGEAYKMQRNSLMHPFVTQKATYDSLKKGNIKTNIRRTMIFQKTSEIKDINDRVKSILANKQKIKDIKTQYRKEYMAGEKSFGKAYAKVTGADKTYADIMANSKD